MIRKEQILNEAIDYSFVEENFLEYDDCGDICDDRDFIQKAFEEGAKWADRTTIEKACEYLKANYSPVKIGELSAYKKFKNRYYKGIKDGLFSIKNESTLRYKVITILGYKIQILRK